MLNLLKKFRKDSGKPGTEQETPGASFSINKVRSKSTHLIGNILSFCIDDHSIQMSAVRHMGKTRRLLDIKKEYFPRSASEQASRRELILREVGDFVAKNSGFGTRVTLAISGPETTFRTFLMPKLKKADMDSAIQFEVKKQIPFPFEDCVYDYRPIYSIEKDDSTRYKVALQAATKRLVLEQLEAFETLGIDVDHVFHTQDVIGEFLKHLPGFSEEKNYTLLNIGLRSTDISFYKGATLEFSHATAISSAMLGSYPEATRYEYFAETISNEIQTSLDYYAGQYSVSVQDRIYVYGDLAYSQDLLSLLNAKSGIDLEPLPVDHLSNFSTRQSDQKDVFPVCLPVLASSVCQTALSNLLPGERKKAYAETRVGMYSRVALALIILALSISWFILRNKEVVTELKLRELQRQVDEFRNSDAFHTYNLVKRQIALDQTYLEQIKEAPSYLALNFKEISKLTPDEITFVYLDYNPQDPEKNLYIHGIVESDDIPPELILAEFIEDLSASPFYEGVSIVRHVKKTIDNKFQIDFQINMRGVV